MAAEDSRQSHHLLGAGMALGSLAFFVAMNVLTKYLNVYPYTAGRPIPSAQKVLYRMVVVIAAILFLARLRLVQWRFGNIPLLILRGVLGAVAVILYFYSIDRTTLARASFLLFTYPAWGALFSYIFLREPLGWKRAPAIIAIYMGAYLILAAGTTAAEAAPMPAAQITGVEAAAGPVAEKARSTRAGDIAGILCGLVSGAAVTTIRALHRHDSTWMIMFFFAFFAAVTAGAMTLATGSHVQPSALEWLVLLGIGATSLGAHAFFTNGFRYLDVTTVGALAMLQAPLSAVAAFFLFGESLTPLTLSGAGLVLAGGVYLARTSSARTMLKGPGAAADSGPTGGGRV